MLCYRLPPLSWWSFDSLCRTRGNSYDFRQNYAYIVPTVNYFVQWWLENGFPWLTFNILTPPTLNIFSLIGSYSGQIMVKKCSNTTAFLFHRPPINIYVNRWFKYISIELPLNSSTHDILFFFFTHLSFTYT